MSNQNQVSTITTIGLLRLPEVLQLLPVSRSTWLNGCRSGIYPKPVKISPRINAWRIADIEALVRQISSLESPKESLL